MEHCTRTKLVDAVDDKIGGRRTMPKLVFVVTGLDGIVKKRFNLS